MDQQLEVESLSNNLDSLRISDEKENDPVVQHVEEYCGILYIPPNWPDTKQYTNTLNWETISDDMKKKFEEGAPSSSYVEIGIINESNELCLLSKSKLPAGAWLDEYSGHVRLAEDVENKRYCVKYVEDDMGIYYIDSLEAGNEMRFIRKTYDKTRANVQFQQLFIDGRMGIFVEIIKAIAPEDEIIAYEEDDGFQTFIEETEEMVFGSEHSVDTLEYVTTPSLHWDKLEESLVINLQRELATVARLAVIDKINKPGHPCHGQYGLFAVATIKKDSYIAEYTGKVITEVEDSNNLYLVDFANPWCEDLGSVWVDAQDEGNETRYINDYKGIRDKENAHFKRIWVSNLMHVFVQALEDIEIGEEILVSYGERYWDRVPTL